MRRATDEISRAARLDRVAGPGLRAAPAIQRDRRRRSPRRLERPQRRRDADLVVDAREGVRSEVRKSLPRGARKIEEVGPGRADHRWFVGNRPPPRAARDASDAVAPGPLVVGVELVVREARAAKDAVLLHGLRRRSVEPRREEPRSVRIERAILRSTFEEARPEPKVHVEHEDAFRRRAAAPPRSREPRGFRRVGERREQLRVRGHAPVAAFSRREEARDASLLAEARREVPATRRSRPEVGRGPAVPRSPYAALVVARRWRPLGPAATSRARRNRRRGGGLGRAATKCRTVRFRGGGAPAPSPPPSTNGQRDFGSAAGTATTCRTPRGASRRRCVRANSEIKRRRTSARSASPGAGAGSGHLSRRRAFAATGPTTRCARRAQRRRRARR